MSQPKHPIDELERQLAANPDDDHLRGQLIIALRRAGRDDEAVQWIQRQFLCGAQWDQLKPLTPKFDDPFAYVDPNVKHCTECDKNVYFVNDAESLNRRAARNQCVAAPQYIVDEYCDRILRPLGPSKERLPQCMNPVQGQRADFHLLRQIPTDCFPYDPMTIAMIRASDIDKAPLEHIVIVTSHPIPPMTIERYLSGTGALSHEIQFTSSETLLSALNQRSHQFHNFNPAIFLGGIGS